MSDPAGVAHFYGRWAGLYDVLATHTPGIGAVRERAVDALELAPGDSVVEIGCGTGANVPRLRDRVGAEGRVVGVDLTPGMLVRAQTRIDRRGWANVHVVRGDGARPPLAQADAVLATFVVGMFEEPGAAVNEWADLVGPGGRLVLLDAAPRGNRGVLDRVFRLFVAASAPPTGKLRYAESPSDSLGSRVTDARDALDSRGAILAEERFGLGFLRLTAARAV